MEKLHRTVPLKSLISTYRANARKSYLASRLKKTNFTIISDDCWGSVIYQELGIKYMTPFVGTQVMTPCYIKILSNLKYYLSSQIVFRNFSKYRKVDDYRKSSNSYFPLGVIDDDIEIQFIHYQSEQEAYEKWYRRIDRMDWQNIYFKLDEIKLGATSELIQRYFTICPENSISFRGKDNSGSREFCQRRISIPNYTENGYLLFYISLGYFDPVTWINQDKYLPSKFHQTMFHLLFPRISSPIS